MSKQPPQPPQPPQPTNIEGLLQSSRRPQPPQPPTGSASRGGSALPSGSSASAGPASQEEKEKLFKRTFNLPESIDTQLTQLTFWSHGEESEKTYVVIKALEQFFANRPKSRKPLPKKGAAGAEDTDETA